MKEQTKIILFLLAIFILAFGIRGNLLQYNSLFEYDAFFHARMTEDLITQGHVNNPDTLAYYQLGGAPQTFTSPVWLLSAGIYQVLFGWNIGFNFDVFTKLMQILPCIFGALICIVIYFIGKAASNGNKMVGIVSAFVAAVTPAFVYRTMAGAQIDNSFGFLPFSIGILFLMWAFTEKDIKKRLIFAVVSGLFFLFMVFAWSMYLIVPLVLIGFWAYYSISRLMVDKDKWKDIYDVGIFFIIFGLFNVGCLLNGFNWINLSAAFMGMQTTVMIIISFIVLVCGSILIVARPQLDTNWKNTMFSIIGVALVILVIGIAYFSTLGVDLVDRTSPGSMVGEEAVGSGFFTQKYNIYNILIPFTFISAIVLFWWKRDKYNYMALLLASFTLFFVMAWLKLKFTFSLGFGIALGSVIIAILFYEIWEVLRRNNKLELKTIFIPATFILLIGVAASGVFILDYVPSLDSDPGLQKVIQYLDTNTPKDANLLNNWGLGHILTYETGRRVSADNRNYSVLANAQFAIFENDSNVDKVYEMVKQMGANYVIVQSDDFYAMQSNQFYIENKVSGNIGVEFTQPITNIIQCSRNGDVLSCPNGQTIDANTLPKWGTTPYDFYNGSSPVFAYNSGATIYVLNTAQNNTNLAKIIAGTPGTEKYYEKVFDEGGYLIFKVK